MLILAEKDLGSSCEPGQCGPSDSVCDSTSNLCECQEGFYDSNGATAGGNCSASMSLILNCLSFSNNYVKYSQLSI